MTTLIGAIDPGARKRKDPTKHRSSYLAVFDAGELIEATPLTYAAALERAGSMRQLAVEKPQLDGRSSEAAAGLLKLSWYGALTIGALGCREIVEYEPDDWKGQTPKPAQHLKIWRVLTPLERQLLPHNTEEIIERGAEATARAGGRVQQYSAEVTNLLDAVALGLFHTKRTRKGGSPYR